MPYPRADDAANQVNYANNFYYNITFGQNAPTKVYFTALSTDVGRA